MRAVAHHVTFGAKHCILQRNRIDTPARRQHTFPTHTIHHRTSPWNPTSLNSLLLQPIHHLIDRVPIELHSPVNDGGNIAPCN